MLKFFGAEELANDTFTFESEEQPAALKRKHDSRDTARRMLRARGLNNASHRTSFFVKRCMDVVGAATGIALLLPLFAVIALAVKTTSRGPVFFSQQRYGLNGRLFTVLKFRSMHTDMCDTTGVAQTVSNDPRVTAVGNFLRKTNLDELPQLFNVLKGDMSLVGPRPHVPGMLAAGKPYEDFDKRYMDRHRVRPGITGLAQVNGFRGETKDAYAARMRIEYDLEYIEQRTLGMDIVIILRTFAREFFKGNGY